MENARPARHVLPVAVAAALAAARRRRGWSYRRAAERTGLGPGYLHALEHAQRCPSTAVAEVLVAGLGLDAAEAAALRAATVAGVGRDRPSRTVAPQKARAGAVGMSR